MGMNNYVNIVLVESSRILCEGISGILNKSDLKCQITVTPSLEDVEQVLLRKKYDIIIVNPTLVLSNPKYFKMLKNQHSNLKTIGLIYAWFDPTNLHSFDGLITISDSAETIKATIKKQIEDSNQTDQNAFQDVLSNRETDVLKLLATGLANKEIADKLNISTHTVISHRKNISQKTGIKSVSGLTIYAVVQKLVSIENINE